MGLPTISGAPAAMEVCKMAVRILAAVIFVPLLLLAMIPGPEWLWACIVALIAAIAAFELLRAAGEGKVTVPMLVISILSAVAIPLGCWAGVGTTTVSVCTFVIMAVSFWCAIRAYDEQTTPIGFYHVLLSIFAGAFVPVGLSALVLLKGMAQGEYLVFFAVIMAFITDAGAYFSGVFLGKHRGITRVSPNKSLEGYIGGCVTGVVFALLYGLAVSAISHNSVNYLSLAVTGLVAALATELGDLAFSLVKRQFGVKDFGHLIPGHGGMLDRFDSMIFCAPVVLFVVKYMPIF